MSRCPVLSRALWFAGLALVVVGSTATGEDCTITTLRPANAFYTGEAVRFSVTVTGARQGARYAVVDRKGAVVRSGSLAVGLGQPMKLALGSTLPTGFYGLRLETVGQATEDTFCVISAPWEDPGDYSLFSLHPDDWSPESLQAAAQIGVRGVRYNILWPNSEPSAGQWDWDYIQRGYRLAQQSGQQMLIVLGYTPTHQAMRAENNHGWVEQAVFTWHPRDPNAYAAYFRNVISYAQDKTVQWPPKSIIPAGWKVPVERRPWVGAWEMWNEVDFVFYFGDWNRYCDLLHLTYACSRSRMPGTPVLYGGSTGNFIAACMLMAGSLRYCYDYNSFHPDEVLEDELSLWYSGEPQIPYCAGLPRETMYTEAYSTGRAPGVPMTEYQETPEDLLRTYLLLKGWREGPYYRSGCNGGWVDDGTRPWPGTRMLVRHDGRLSPTPLYPAFAAARQLLSDATTVGPVWLADGVTGYVFLKHGKVMLAAWSDKPTEVTIHLEPRAYTVDAMGRHWPIRDQVRWRATLGASPLVVVGARENLYLSRALRRQFAMFWDTYFGVPEWKACTVWYVKRLAYDVADWAGPTAPWRVLQAVRAAESALAADPAKGPKAIMNAQDVCYSVMQQIAPRCLDNGRIVARPASTLWRLARVSEWLGEVADALGARNSEPGLSPAQYERLCRRLDEVARGLPASLRDANAPLADLLLRRARQQLQQAATSRGRGRCRTAEQEIGLAAQVGRSEPGLVLQVVPLMDFPTGHLMLKAWLLEPGMQHTLRTWVYNYRPATVRGELTITTPDGWEPRSLTVPFTAPPDGPSAPVDVTVSITGEPRPWHTVSSFTLNEMLELELPPSLSDRPEISLKGVLADGSVIPEMVYFVNVGHWLGRSGEATSAAASGALQVGPLAAWGALRPAPEPPVSVTQPQ